MIGAAEIRHALREASDSHSRGESNDAYFARLGLDEEGATAFAKEYVARQALLPVAAAVDPIGTYAALAVRWLALGITVGRDYPEGDR